MQPQINTSLTSKNDYVKDAPRVSYQGVRLTEEQVAAAVDELVDTTTIDKFPRVEKFYADPVHNNQMYCLHSFVPSKEAVPDKHGVFGFMKCRGTYFTALEAAQRAEEIIRNVDSNHALQTAYVGRPFPVCTDARKFSQETVDVDIRKKAEEVISEDLRGKRQEDRKVMKEIKERERRLLAESKEDYEEDPLERYIMLRTKKAQLSWTYAKTLEKMATMKTSILTAREDIIEMDKENPQFVHEYMERYMAARRESGLDQQPDNDDNFLKYMGAEDVDIGF
jgi:hypothetical protein